MATLHHARGDVTPHPTREFTNRHYDYYHGREIEGHVGAFPCENGKRLFQLDVCADGDSCETSWTLRRISIDEYGDVTPALVDGHGGDYYDVRHATSRSLCLDEGEYEFTISDAFGDGIAAPGYYLVALDGAVLAGSSDFGYEETTSFTVVSEGSSGSVTVETAYMAEAETASDLEVANAPSSVDKDLAADAPLTPDRISGIVEVSFANESDPPTASPSGSASASPPGAPAGSEWTDMDPRARGEEVPDGPSSSSNTSIQTWREIFGDGFEEGLGIFGASSGHTEYVTYYPFVKGRRGVVRLQNERAGADNCSARSSVVSENIVLNPTARKVRVAFSFYANSMESGDGFCLDHSLDDGTSWCTAGCWHAGKDFNNGRWYDDVVVAFDLDGTHNEYSGVANGVRIRFRSKANSLHDDVLIDGVQVLELAGTEGKDSML